MVALDPLNRRATRHTFISRASKGARRVAAERERECERTGKREKGREGGRKDRGPCNNAAYGACSSRATARDAVQLPAASVGSRTKARTPSYRVVVPFCSSSLLSSLFLVRPLHFARERFPSFLPSALSSSAVFFQLPRPSSSFVLGTCRT